MSLKKAIFADVWRIYGCASWFKVAAAFVRYRSFRPILTYRIGRYLKLKSSFFKYLLLPVIKVFHRWFQASLNCEIPFAADIGAGLYFNHGYIVVISKDSRIGSNFTCFHLVTLGVQVATDAPVVGNNVVILAGAMVIGPVTISDGATIGASSLILKDVDENAIVAGNPQKLIRIAEAPRTPYPAPDYLLS